VKSEALIVIEAKEALTLNDPSPIENLNKSMIDSQNQKTHRENDLNKKEVPIAL